MQRLRVQRGRLKSIFGIDRTASEEPPNRPSGGWRGCAVPAFSPQAKTLAQGEFISPEHFDPKGPLRGLTRGEVMPGLPKVPAAEKIDVDENGRITGLF